MSRGRGTRPKRAALAAFVLLLSLATLRPALALELPGSDYVRRRVETALRDALGGETTIARLSVHPIDGAVSFEGIEVRPRERSILTSLSLRSGRAEISLSDLLRGDVRLRALEVDGLRIALAMPEGERPQRTPGPLFDARILSALERVRVGDGAVTYDDREIPFSLDVDGIVIEGNPDAGRVTGVASVGRAEFESGVFPRQHFERGRFRFRWQSPRLEFELIDASGGGGKVSARGQVSLTSQGILLHGTFDGDLDIEPFVARDVPGSKGPVHAQAAFRVAEPGTWRVDGTLRTRGRVELAGMGLSEGSTRFALSPSGVALSDTQAVLADGTEVTALDLSRPPGGPVNVSARGVSDVQRLLRAVDAGRRASQLHGTARWTFDATVPAHGALRWTLGADVAPAGAGRGALRGRIAGTGGAEGGRVSYDGALDLTTGSLAFTWGPEGPTGPWRVAGALAAAPGEAARIARADLVRYLADEDIELPPGVIPYPHGAFAVDVLFEGRGASLARADLPFRLERPRFAPDAGALGRATPELLEGRVQLGAGGRFRVDFRVADAEGQGLGGTVAGRGGSARVDIVADGVPLPVVREYVRGAFDVDLPPSEGRLDGFAGGTIAFDRIDIAFGAHVDATVGGVPGVMLDASGRYRGDTVDLPLATLRAPGASARFAGRIALPGGLEAWGVQGGIEFEGDLAALSRHLGRTGHQGRVVAAANVAFSGEDRPLRAEGTFGWNGVILSGVALPDGTGGLANAADGTDVTLAIDGSRAIARLAGPIGDPRLTLSAHWRDLAVLDLAGLLLRRPLALGLDIESDGAIELAGRAFDPATWQGGGTIERLDLLSSIVGGRLSAPAGLVFDPGGRVRTDPARPLVLLGAAGGRLSLDGAVAWYGADAGRLDLRADGSADLNVLEVFDPDIIAAGSLAGTLTVGGVASAPQISGTAKIAGGRVRVLPFTDVVDDLAATLTFAPGGITITDGSLHLGGGTVTLGGIVRLDGWMPGRFDLAVRARDVALNVPKGIWGRYDADLKVQGRATEPEVSGDVRMLAGRYSKPFDIGGPVGGGRKLAPQTRRSHWTARIGLRLHVTADDTVAVRNDMARLQAGATLDVTGDVGQPLIAGSIVLVEGGRFTLRDIDYEVVSGQVIFDDPRGEPMIVRLRATTEVRGYRIQLDLDATTDTLDYQLTSVPALSRNDILWLLLNRQTPDEASTTNRSQGLADLATGYFGTALGELVLRGRAKQLFGIDVFQLAPSFVGAEARPTARVTIGKRVDERTTVVYSRDLSGEGRDVYRIERNLTRELRAALGREQLGGVAADLRWLHRFGEGDAAGAASTTPRLAHVTLLGLPAGTKIRLKRDLGLVTGERMPRFAFITAREALLRVLAESGYLEAAVTDRVETRPGRGGVARATVVFEIAPGPRWDVTYKGPDAAVRRARSALADFWSTTSFREDSLREAIRLVREAFAEDGFANAVIDIRRPDPIARALAVTIDPGPKVSVDRIRFEGLRALSEDDVRRQVLQRASRLLDPLVAGGNEAIYRPRLVAEDAEAIVTLYAESGFLETVVTPRVGFSPEGDRAYVTFVVEEGPPSTVRAVRVEGKWPEELPPATSMIRLRSGDPFLPDALRNAETALRFALDTAGYPEARVTTRPEVASGTVEITFRVQPRRREVIDQVAYEGLSVTRRKLAERAVFVKAGDPLSSGALRRTESELFRLGVFRNVEVLATPVDGDVSRQKVTIRVEENPRVSILTSIGYDTEERLRGSVSLSNDNLWGLARTGSLQAFASSIREGVRATLEDRHLRRGRSEGLVTFATEREDRGGFLLRTTGAAVQIGSPLRAQRRWQLRYELEDNRFSRVTLDPEAIEEILQQDGRRLDPVRLGGLLGSFIIDRRNDPFVPKDGWIARTEVGVWGAPLASEETFARLTGQIGAYRTRGRVTLAGSSRFGLSRAFGASAAVPLSRRFFAGGAESLRAFPRDKAGPLDTDGDPLGGEALLVTNIEARYRVWREAYLMGFYDVGNVWLSASDFYKGKLRKAAGLGLRYNTPLGALRIEYGWKLNRRPDESRGEFYVSIGEAF